MSKKTRSFRVDREGASGIEFALVTPVFLLILMGVVDFGALFYAQNSAQNAARHVARQIAVNRLDIDSAEKAIEGDLAHWVAGDSALAIKETNPGSPSTNEITVSITFPAAAGTLTGFFGSLLSDRHVTGFATMQQEKPL
ncbi:Flp pilus assembly protein TadG [Pseudorhizobium tarimense]|uniref:Flp pilus assembly protein TadG n=1 Tax=Pseudorhizobium tarimense TaxID=1079109 RepID=A0ABV2HE08_9HYPH|nr:TadE/TadG family type IV pilus assembly protein [Pseudorhizobium tarimense]MCJ8521732.1 pilus assembly protein [Pseudorhizobium tarimense]